MSDVSTVTLADGESITIGSVTSVFEYTVGVPSTDVVEVSASSGVQGQTGYTGSVGIAGLIGYTGSIGAGYTGSIGNLGYTGSIGAGYTGSVGVGYTGSLGSTGYTGSAGNLGYTGSVGTQGAIGYTGSGSLGSVGYTGSRGYTGSVGYTGSIGTIGYTGSRGYTGSAGPGADQSVNTTSAVTFANVTTSLITGTNSNTTITANNKVWTFDYTGNITFPDLTTQSTAYTNIKSLQTVSANTTANSTVEIIFVDTNLAGANVNITLPSAATTGKVYTVKNINAGGFSALVTSDIASRIEDPTTGGFVTSYALSSSGNVHTWVSDSGYFRVVG